MIALVLGGCASSGPRIDPETQLPAAVELQQIEGAWYVLEHIPYFAERDKVAARVEYRRRSDGRYDDLYTFKRSLDEPDETWKGVAWVLNPGANTRWKARFWWPLSNEFYVIAIAGSGRWMTLATPDRKLAWIYARSAVLEPVELEAARATLATVGVDLGQLATIAQDAVGPGH